MSTGYKGLDRTILKTFHNPLSNGSHTRSFPQISKNRPTEISHQEQSRNIHPRSASQQGDQMCLGEKIAQYRRKKSNPYFEELF
jgi:hypothetical protein